MQNDCAGPSMKPGEVCIWDFEDAECASAEMKDLDEYFMCNELEDYASCVSYGMVGYGFACSWNTYENECVASYMYPVQAATDNGINVPCKFIYTPELCTAPRCFWKE